MLLTKIPKNILRLRQWLVFMRYAIILFVYSDYEICEHYKHLESNGIVEWGVYKPIKADELVKQKTFYAYTYISGKGIKYRFLVNDFKSNDEGQEAVPPFNLKNVPWHYPEHDKKPEHKSWLKITKIEKLNSIMRLNDFKKPDGKRCSDKPSPGGYWKIIDNRFETEIYTKNDCPTAQLTFPLKQNHSEKDLESFLYKNPQKLGKNLTVLKRQYQYIDLLMKDRKKYVVVELKTQANSSTLAQVIEYIDVIEKEFQKPTRGLIVCEDYEPRLKNSVDWLKRNGIEIELVTYTTR